MVDEDSADRSTADPSKNDDLAAEAEDELEDAARRLVAAVP